MPGTARTLLITCGGIVFVLGAALGVYFFPARDVYGGLVVIGGIIALVGVIVLAIALFVSK